MPSDSNDVELVRLKLGAVIVGCSITAVILALIVVCHSMGTAPLTATDCVALMGSVTTFMGLAVGILFGVNAGGSARASASEAATQMSSAAGKVADAAKAAADSAQQATDAAARTLDTSHAVWRQLQPSVSATPSSSSSTDGVEMLAGDPDETATALVLSSARALDSFTRGMIHIASPAPAQTLFSSTVLGVADAEAAAGVSRASNRLRVTQYLNLLGLDFLDPHGIPTRYCAAGVTWATCKAYCDLNSIAYTPANELAIFRSVLGDVGRFYFKPSAGCQIIMDDAKSRDAFLSQAHTALPGYLVFYNWKGAAHAEHIGIVEGADAAGLKTVEFNTAFASGPNQGDGGAVSKKSRPLKFVLGYAKTY